MKILQKHCKKEKTISCENLHFLLSFTLNAHFFKLLLSDGSEMNGKLFYACYPIKTRKQYIIPFPYLSIRLKKKILFVIRLFFSICTNVYCFHVGQSLNSSVF